MVKSTLKGDVDLQARFIHVGDVSEEEASSELHLRDADRAVRIQQLLTELNVCENKEFVF